MRFYRLPYILYRDYPDFGYLTDNRNFGYDTASGSCVKVGDRILSKTGSVFYSALTESPQTVKELANRLLPLFVGVSSLEIENDAEAFFQELAIDGFVGQGDNTSSFPEYFSYANKTRIELIEGDAQGKTDESILGMWGEQYHLSRVHLEISGRCNERCQHCYFPNTYSKGLMPRELFLEILGQCKTNRVLSITISGGEPMLHPDLLFFINECWENDFSINLLSNLTLLTDEMLQEFSRMPLLSVQTSLYAMDPEIHDSITRQKGSYEKTRKAIEKLHRHNIPMQINCPIMKQNRFSYRAVLEWAESLNIEASSDYMLFGCFDGSQANLKSRLELGELDLIIKEELENGFGIDRNREFKQGVRNKDYTICPVCLNSLCISHTGDIYPCEGWQSYILGNIKEESLMRVWTESEGVQTLRQLTYDDFPKCSVCGDKDYCSICLLRNANESQKGDFKELNPFFCSIARKKRQVASEN